jgi:hypothetical protein
MKRVLLSVALVLGLGMTKARAQEVEPSSEQGKQGVVSRIFDDMKESTRTVREINKVHFAAQKETFKAMHAEATQPNPGFEKFWQASGFKGKVQALGENFRESCAEASEKEKERREQIKSHEGYKRILEQTTTPIKYGIM